MVVNQFKSAGDGWLWERGAGVAGRRVGAKKGQGAEKSALWRDRGLVAGWVTCACVRPCWAGGRCSSGGGGQSAVGAVVQMMEAGSHLASVQWWRGNRWSDVGQQLTGQIRRDTGQMMGAEWPSSDLGSSKSPAKRTWLVTDAVQLGIVFMYVGQFPQSDYSCSESPFILHLCLQYLDLKTYWLILFCFK